LFSECGYYFCRPRASNLGGDPSQFGDKLFQALSFQLRRKILGADRRSFSPRPHLSDNSNDGFLIGDVAAKLASLHWCTYTLSVDFEWDPQKANSNRRRRRIDFADAATVFDDEFAVTIPDDHPDEDRYVTIGMDALARLLVVVWTYRGENIRIISARKATRFEQRQYNEGI
jgi:hypothetical protein